jgi:CubicO group peptidase (beta-lactamase class C family)
MIIARPLRLLSCLVFAATAWLRGGPLEDALARAHAEHLREGYGVCLFTGGGATWTHCAGFADEDAQVRFTPDTVFRVGAVSELVTVALALRLADAGRLDLDGPVAGALPDLFGQAPAGSPLERVGRMSPRLLMSHLAGTDAGYFLNYADYDPFVNLRKYLSDVNLKYPPGVKYVRSGGMIDLLGLVLQRVGGQPFETLAQGEVFGPLGMASSSFRYQGSAQFARVRYKSAPPDWYATWLPGFRDVLAPCGSLQTSLRDLTAFGTALLDPASTFLAPAARADLFTPRNPEAAARQGFAAGYVWKLTLPELAYLGRVAWYSGKFLSHRCVIVLLPDRDLGVVCATNSWSIFDRETLLPMAIELLEAQAQVRYGIREPEAPRWMPEPLGPSLRAALPGCYASEFGVYRVAVGPASLQLASSALDADLVHTGGGVFRAAGAGSVLRAAFTAPDALDLKLRDGMALEATRIEPSRAHRAWLRRHGTYRLADPVDNALFAFTLEQFAGLPVISSGDDGVQFLVEPRPDGSAGIRCDEASRLFGRELRVLGAGELSLGGIRYRLTR